MAYGGEHQIQPEYGDEQTDEERVCRTHLARPNSQANADREEFIFTVQLTTSRIGNLTRLIHTLAICVTIHFKQTTYRIGNQVYYWVWLRPDRFM